METLRAQDVEQAEAPAVRGRRGWRDTPLSSKLAVVVVMAAVGGMAAASLDAVLGNPGWPLVVVLAAAIAGPLYLARRAVWSPLERLLYEADHAWKVHRPTRAIELPMNEGDEIARLAELVHRHTLRGYQHEREAEQLRRTLDQRVEEATGLATRHLEQMAMRDPLTGLGNRRFLDRHLRSIVAACRTGDQDVICLAADLDHFKPINDTLGHAAGDKLLRLLGQLIRANLRGEDAAIRLGGDEFILLLPGGDVATAMAIAERLRQLFEQHVRTTLPRNLQTGLSFGVASFQRDGLSSGEALLRLADSRLYRAKEAGKGQIVAPT